MRVDCLQVGTTSDEATETGQHRPCRRGSTTGSGLETRGRSRGAATGPQAMFQFLNIVSAD
jgi:hypothetical protein